MLFSLFSPSVTMNVCSIYIQDYIPSQNHGLSSMQCFIKSSVTRHDIKFKNYCRKWKYQRQKV